MTHSDHVVAMETVSDELLPCPFCGGAAKLTYSKGFGFEQPPDTTMAMTGCNACGFFSDYKSTPKAIAAWNRRAPSELLASRLAKQAPATHRHKKRGSEYVLIGIGKMQAERWQSGEKLFHSVDQYTVGEIKKILGVDMREVAIYRSVDDGSLLARPIEEFNDGRFEVLPSPVLGEPK